jgi:hypothetical protein
MRRLGIAVCLLVGALAAPVHAGSADAPSDPDAEAEPRLPTVQLVQAWPKTKQALLYDPIQGTYVVVSAGQNIDGFRVSRIGKNQIVLSTLGGAARDYVLLPTPVADLPDAPAPTANAPTAPPPPAAPKPADTTAPTPPPGAPPRPDLIDPYPAGVLDPYGADGVREVEAPPQAKAPATPPPPTGTVVVTPLPSTKPATPPPGKPAPAKPAPTKPTPVPAITKPTPAPAPAPVVPSVRPDRAPATDEAKGNVVLSKKELDAALSDFATLTKDSRLTLGPSGVAFAHVAPGSLFARVGLKDGDRIVSINGTAIHSLDDAANLYAQLGGMKLLVLDVARGAGHVTLKADLR